MGEELEAAGTPILWGVRVGPCSGQPISLMTFHGVIVGLAWFGIIFASE